MRMCRSCGVLGYLRFIGESRWDLGVLCSMSLPYRGQEAPVLEQLRCGALGLWGGNPTCLVFRVH